MAKKAAKLSFWDLLEYFCLESSILGLKYFYLYPDRLSRCFWALSIAIAFGFALVLSRLLYSRFIEMPTRITIDNQFASVTDLPWPAITVCSPNQLTIRNMEHYNQTLNDGITEPIDLHHSLTQLLGFYEIIPEKNETLLSYLQEIMIKNRYDVPHLMSMLPQSCDDFIKLCIFEGEVRNCSDLFEPIFTTHGLCCIFNSPFHLRNHLIGKYRNFTPRLAKSGSFREKLTIVTDYEPSNALNRSLLNAGAIRLMFNDWPELPADDESCLVYPHAESFITLQGIHTYCSDDVKQLEPEFRRCLFPNEGERNWEKQLGYHNSDCDLMCTVEAIRKKCHCAMFYIWKTLLSEKGYHHICNITDIPCIMDSKQTYAENFDVCNCPRDCDARQYKTNMNIGNLGAIDYLINSPYSHLKFNMSTTLMHFFFANTFYLQQKQETVMSIISLASNLGGVFGLCLGCSVISVLEILFFIYKAIKNHLQNRWASKYE